MNHLKSNHEATGRSYPRPTINCPECNTILILCWGNQISKPYLRHKVSNCNKNSESLLHKLAKELLCTKLNTGLALFCEKTCQCNEKEVIDVPRNIKWKCESYIFSGNQKGYLDIAGFDNNLILFGIEIYNTHITENITARDKIIWVELDATDVLDKLDSDTTVTNLTISDKRTFICSKCTESKKYNVSNNSQDYYCSKPTEKTLHKDKWKQDGIKKYEYLSVNKIAKRLGFLNEVDYYHCEEEKYIMMARFGKYKFKYQWSLEEFNVENDGKKDWDRLHLMNAFLERRICMRCKKNIMLKHIIVIVMTVIKILKMMKIHRKK